MLAEESGRGGSQVGKEKTGKATAAIIHETLFRGRNDDTKICFSFKDITFTRMNEGGWFPHMATKNTTNARKAAR